jgi:hypothetical protein
MNMDEHEHAKDDFGLVDVSEAGIDITVPETEDDIRAREAEEFQRRLNAKPPRVRDGVRDTQAR